MPKADWLAQWMQGTYIRAASHSGRCGATNKNQANEGCCHMTTTNWTDLLLDAAPVRAIYGPKAPTLDAIDLHEIILHRDGPRVLLRFDLRDFPEHPPQKWTVAGFNRVQIRLLASGVRELQIDGLQSNTQVDLGIDQAGPLIRLHANNGFVRFDVAVQSVTVQSISAYRDESAG